MQKLTGVRRIRTALVWVLFLSILASLLGMTPAITVADSPQPETASIGLSPGDNFTPSVNSAQSWLPTTSAGTTSDDIESMVSIISKFEEETRGLKFKSEVPVKKVSRQQFTIGLMEQQVKDASESAWDFNNVTYDAMHLFPEGVSAEEGISVDLGATTLAYYDPSEKDIVYIDQPNGSNGDLAATLAHELDHALIDQNFPSIFNNPSASTSDSFWAARSLAEGDATLIESSFYYSAQYDVLKSLSLPYLHNLAFNSRPPSLQDQNYGYTMWTLYPYLDGSNFVYSLYKKGSSKDPWSEVNKAYSKPPQTTEQIAYPAKYPKESAITVKVPATTSGDWQILGSDTLGEMGLSVMFFGQGMTKLVKNAVGLYTCDSSLTASWGGDEIVGYKSAAGKLGYAWVIEMDTPAAAKGLLTGYQKMLLKMKAKASDSLWQLGNKYIKIALIGKQVMIVSAPSAEDVDQLWPGPSISVISPNGGEDWQVGTTQTITWTSNGFDAKAKVKIELSRDGGKTWKAIIPTTLNDGSQDWKVAAPASTLAMIRVVSATSKDILDVSDASFTISKP